MQATVQQAQRAPDDAPVHDERHRTEQTTLYRLLQQHAALFIAHTEASTGSERPRFIQAEAGHKQSGGLSVPGEGLGLWPGAACKAEFDAFLECGIVVHGDADGVPSLVEAGAPTDDGLHALPHHLIARLMKQLTRRA